MVCHDSVLISGRFMVGHDVIKLIKICILEEYIMMQ